MNHPSNLKESVMRLLFTACACVSILAVALICLFLFANGLPAIGKIGPLQFLLGQSWKPGNDIYGILPMILGSIYVTAGALVVGVPIGLLTAIYMSRFAIPAVNRVLQPAVELLAGIPSVVYGFFGMMLLAPAVQEFVKTDFATMVLGIKSGKGQSLVTASLLLGITCLVLFYTRRFKHTKKTGTMYTVVTVLLTVMGVVYTGMGLLGILTMFGII